MASPMQDAAVSSSGSGVRSPGPDTSESEDLTCNTTVQKVFYYEAAPCQVKTVQHSGNCCSWMTEFNEAMCRLASCSNFQLFIQSLAVYAKNVASDAIIYSSDLSKLALLRSHMSNVLLYYHFHWCGDAKGMDDHFSYLQNMSDIMITYVNLELRFSSTSESSQKELMMKLLHELCLYLDCSEEHIFKVLLKSELVNEQFKTICSPIMRKFFLQALSNREHLTSIMYMRYIITFKLWRSIYNLKTDEKEIREIESLALQLIGSDIPPSCFDAVDFFPKPLERCINKTLWYLKTPSFDLETTIENFLRFEEDSYPHQHEPGLAKRCRNQYHLKICDNTRINPHSHSKSKPKLVTRRKINSEEILIVDLTEERDTINRVKNVQSKEIGWLKSFKENPKRLDHPKFLDEKVVIGPSSISECPRSSSTAMWISDDDVNKFFMMNMPDSNNVISNTNIFSGDLNILNDSCDIFDKCDIYDPTFFNEYNTENLALPLSDTINWMRKMPNFHEETWEETVYPKTTSDEIGNGITNDANGVNGDVFKHERKRFVSTLKTDECPPLKMKKLEFFSLDSDGSIPWLDQDIKLEDELPTPFIERHVDLIGQLNSPSRSQKNTLQHQLCDESTNYSRLQALVDWINSNGGENIITVFDSGNPILREFMSKKIKPTASHYFVRLLCEKKLLLRHYTENNGGLEKLAGVPSGKYIDFSEKDVSSRSSFPLSNCDISQAGLVIFFTNSLSSVSRWFQGKHPRLFIIQEKTVETENMSPRDFLKLNSIPQDDFKLENDSNINVIQAETCDKFCSLLVRLLGWNEDLKKVQQQFEKHVEIC